MADALGRRVEQLIEQYLTFIHSYEVEDSDTRRMMTESFDGLMSYLRELMVGYENEQVLALLNEMESVVACEAWARYDETVMADRMIRLLIENHVNRIPLYERAAPLTKRRMTKSFDRLMSYLRRKIVGLGGEVLAFLKDMEALVACEDWDRHEETGTSDTIERWLEFMTETWMNDIWDTRIERRLDKMILICEQICNIRYNVAEQEAVVGYDDEMEILLDQLTSPSMKQFQIISITGAAGLGKTTLARMLYDHELIKYMFDFRAWTTVSQSYIKKDLLVSILSCFIQDLTNDYYEMNEQQLGETLYRKLKGRTYLVVLDDIWDCRVWNDLKIYFPDDKTGSRVLFTCRDIDLSSHVQSARPAHVLRLRTEVESWAIFLKRVFRMGICPKGLEKYGQVINRKCKGLPLAIVIAAGLVKNNLSDTWWEKIANSLHSYMVSDPGQFIDSLSLSYNHLPPHLRRCFLFFGAFPEDYEVAVTKLIWLWIAQGIIHETTGSRLLEDVARDFLMDLIKRSVVMTQRTKADGQFKTCHIHDLLHDFCLRKAEEEKFLSDGYRYDMVSSMLCFPSELGTSLQEGGSIHIDTYKFLKILDIESILISLFPLDAVQMVNLRYLAIQARNGSPHASISNLVNLQMLIISSRENVVVPKTIWNMVNLRHLYIKSGENLMEKPSFLQVTGKDDRPRPTVLANLQTLSQVSPRSCHNIFSRTPNLRKLGFYGPLISSLGELEFPDLDSLVHLQKLKLLNRSSWNATRACNPIMFPEKLKKLTLLNTSLDWNEMWTFAWLPNLEVLKLKFQACIGERWETGDAEFRRLKVLKLQDLDIEQWVCSRDNFPRLQCLAINRCLQLGSLPTTLGNILTLEVIEVNGCSLSAYRSAVEIQKEQESEGNCFLKVHGKQNGRHLCSLMHGNAGKLPSPVPDTSPGRKPRRNRRETFPRRTQFLGDVSRTVSEVGAVFKPFPSLQGPFLHVSNTQEWR